MAKANAEIEYDPELPFAFVGRSGKVVARFSDLEFARQFGVHCLVGSVVDTTPKPKIPEDAEFIYYLDSGGDDQFGHRDTYEGKEGWWTGAGDYLTTSELLEYIGDAEVNVLVRKDET